MVYLFNSEYAGSSRLHASPLKSTANVNRSNPDAKEASVHGQWKAFSTELQRQSIVTLIVGNIAKSDELIQLFIVKLFALVPSG